eukprot:TRINITY_DN5705_c1_g1_i1.p1 TRINITY_DN5705_c1_g1~~TRINITY_DN5705_c1_g1_i1.p1  ORF type:complete len:339 (+),score=-39.66 TRINITY_DN5705_c1_g1_i1:3-1019(+)
MHILYNFVFNIILKGLYACIQQRPRWLQNLQSYTNVYISILFKNYCKLIKTMIACSCSACTYFCQMLGYYYYAYVTASIKCQFKYTTLLHNLKVQHTLPSYIYMNNAHIRTHSQNACIYKCIQLYTCVCTSRERKIEKYIYVSLNIIKTDNFYNMTCNKSLICLMCCRQTHKNIIKCMHKHDHMHLCMHIDFPRKIPDNYNPIIYPSQLQFQIKKIYQQQLPYLLIQQETILKQYILLPPKRKQYAFNQYTKQYVIYYTNSTNTINHQLQQSICIMTNGIILIFHYKSQKNTHKQTQIYKNITKNTQEKVNFVRSKQQQLILTVSQTFVDVSKLNYFI